MTESAAERVLRILIALGIALLALGAGLASAREPGPQDAADRAAETADEIRGAILTIDPDGPDELQDSSRDSGETPIGAALAPGEVPSVDLPPLPGGPSAADDPFVIRSVLPIEGSIRYGEWFWEESAAPAEGPLVITVDLEARVISAFRGGHEIGTAVALLGTKRHPTPLGTFPILTKEKDNIFEKYNNAPMPWTLRLTWDGIAIHGSPVINGYASHGCIGVPDPFAQKLFEAAERGDKVVITRGRYVAVGDRLLS